MAEIGCGKDEGGFMSTKKTPELLLPKFGEQLVNLGIISKEHLSLALDHQKKVKIIHPDETPPLVGQILVQLNFLSQSDLDSAVTDLFIKLKDALEDSNHKLESRVEERTRKLEQAIRKIKKLNDSKSEFVSNISHELNTPLTHIMGYTCLFLDGSLGEINQDQKEALGTIKLAADRLGELITDLISFTDIENDVLVIQPMPTSPSDICKKAFSSCLKAANKKSIHLVQQCQDELPEITADRDKISWVVKQLLNNAIKFTEPNGYVLLKVKLNHNFVDFSIFDTGIGIPENKINDIFEPFHQLDGSTTRSAGGTGIGLTISKEIIKAHNSKIIVTSKLNKGSEFTFSLPIVDGLS